MPVIILNQKMTKILSLTDPLQPDPFHPLSSSQPGTHHSFFQHPISTFNCLGKAFLTYCRHRLLCDLTFIKALFTSYRVFVPLQVNPEFLRVSLELSRCI